MGLIRSRFSAEGWVSGKLACIFNWHHMSLLKKLHMVWGGEAGVVFLVLSESPLRCHVKMVYKKKLKVCSQPLPPSLPRELSNLCALLREYLFMLSPTWNRSDTL